MTMPDISRSRKAALVIAGVTNRQVAEATGVDETLVSHVLAGRRLHMPEAQKVMDYVAAISGKPVEDLWPASAVESDEDDAA